VAAPIGANVSLYYDSRRHVEVGHFIQTPTGRTYLVTDVRRQARGEHIGRWHLRADVVPEDWPQPYDVVHPLSWYRR
jgi:hypothetical protein